MAEITQAGTGGLEAELNTLSLKALGATTPYSDNTTGTALRWLGH